MNVVSVCPLRVASLDWQTSRGVPVITVIAKGSFRLSPVTCPIAEEQEDPNEYESHWNYDPERSLHSPSDFVPYKPRPEVTLVGQAFAPRGEPTARLLARLIVGGVDKSIAVHADRSFSQDGVLRHGPRFTRMPLRYEKAAGGPETRNPVGVTGKLDALGATALPNLEPPGLNVTRPDELIEPVGFGPIAADWPERRARLGHHAGTWSVSALRGAALPEGIDPLHFLSAPADQHLDELRANERIVLENLHPEHPRLVTSLPGYEPRAFVVRARGAPVELPMVCDTLWIDTDRSVCTLTWRAQLSLDHAAEDGRVVVAMEMIGRPLTWSDIEALAPPPSITMGSMEDTRPRPPKERNTAVHEARPAMPSWPAWLSSTDGDETLAPMIPGGDAPAPQPPQPPQPHPAPLAGDVRLTDFGRTGTVDVAVPKAVIEAAIARAEATRSRPALPPPPGPPPIAPKVAAPDTSTPSWLRASGSPPATPPSTVGTPWGIPSAASPLPAPAPLPPIHAPPVSLASPITPAQRATYPQVAPPPAFDPTAARPRTAADDPSPPARVPSAVDLRQATERGVVAASNAAAAGAREAASPAADGAPPAAPAREPAREHVDLLWFDPTALPRIRADRALGEARPERPESRWSKDGGGLREPQEARDRSEILTIISRGRPVDEPAALEHVASAAYHDDGTFTAPLVLVGGELAFDFDEVETLRATLTVVAPFVGSDKKLREVAGNAADALKAEGKLPGDIAAGLTRRVEEAFAQGQRSVAPAYLDTSVERILLEDRRYPKKTLFGEPRLRALLSLPGGSAPFPTYLPEALATRLPLFRRFKARAIVELRPQEDQYETHPDALLVLALGRVLRRAG